jgi:hypothetical protein
MQQEAGEKKEWGLGKDVLYLGAAKAKPRKEMRPRHAKMVAGEKTLFPAPAARTEPGTL